MPFPSLNISELEGSENRETANRNRSLPSPNNAKKLGTNQKRSFIQAFYNFPTSAGRTLLIGPDFQSVLEPKLASFLRRFDGRSRPSHAYDPIQIFRRRTPFIGLSKPVSMPFPSLNISELEGSENREKANRNRSLPSPNNAKILGTNQKRSFIQAFHNFPNFCW